MSNDTPAPAPMTASDPQTETDLRYIASHDHVVSSRLRAHIDALTARALAAEAQLKEAREALETYADERNWTGDVFKLERLEATCKCLGCWERYSDQGAVARAALQPQGEK